MINDRASSPSSPYFPAIDGLRAVAVLSVLVFHLHEPALPGGYVGVDIFFVISGFVVTGSIAHLKFNKLHEFQAYFYSRRIVRIGPALIFCLVVTGLARTLFIPSAWLSDLVNKTGFAAFFGLSNLVLALNTDEYFSPRAAFNPFVHTWSLGVEEQFYLIFPFLVYYFYGNDSNSRRRTGAVVVGLLCVLSFVACGVLSWFRWEYAFYLLPARFWELGCGVLLYLTMPKWKDGIAALSPAICGVAFLTSVGLFGVSLRLAPTDFFPFPLAIVPVASSVIVIALVVARPYAAPARLFASRLPVFIGKISYSLYLWHWPVFVLFRWTIGSEGFAKGATEVAIAFALAVGSFRFIESPIRRFGWPQILPPRGVIVFGLLIVGAASVVTHEILAHVRSLTLSVTGDTDTWYPDDNHKLAPSVIGCGLNAAYIAIGSVAITSWMPSHCSARGKMRLHVVGDSHAGAYVPMLRQFAVDTGDDVRLYQHSGCGFVALDIPTAKEEEDCKEFTQESLSLLIGDLDQGDVIFLPSLRLPRYKNQWGEISASNSSTDPDQQRTLRGQAVSEAVSFLNAFRSRGALIVFEAPTPMFKSPPFRCSDWFNASNKVCSDGFSVRREELESLREPTLESMEFLVARVPGVSIWDPFVILCPGKVCSTFKDGKPLFFDGDHISGFANDVLYPDFSAHILGAQ